MQPRLTVLLRNVGVTPASDNIKKKKEREKKFFKKDNHVPFQGTPTDGVSLSSCPRNCLGQQTVGIFLLATLWSSVIFESTVHPKRKPTKVNRGSRQRQEYLVETKLSPVAAPGPARTRQPSSAVAKHGEASGRLSLSMGSILKQKHPNQWFSNCVPRTLRAPRTSAQGPRGGKQTSSRPPHLITKAPFCLLYTPACRTQVCSTKRALQLKKQINKP